MIGTTIGPYRVVRKLGAGGMGAVFEAVHKTIEHRVCIKILHPEYAKDAEFAQRFFNEARAVNRADHPGLVQVSDYGHMEDGTAYIVMELVKGETLGQRLRQLGGPMPVGEVLRIGQQIADSLAAAHAKNIVHRDIKPDKAGRPHCRSAASWGGRPGKGCSTIPAGARLRPGSAYQRPWMSDMNW